MEGTGIVASLFVIQGTDQGKRFELKARPMALGRDGSNPIRLHDNEVSRRHAEVRPADDARAFRVVDLGSANGTYVNGKAVDQVALRPGDQLRLGQTVMLFSEGGAPPEKDLTTRVDLLGKASPEDRSAIIKSIPAADGSRVLEAGGAAGDWLKVRLANLSVMYQATQAISHVTDVDALLPQVLQLVFDSIGADRGAILLADDEGELRPKAVLWKGEADPDERMTISRTIVDHVREQGQGVITSDASGDTRFGPSQSIVDYLIREAICVPIQGRHTTLGVLYADVRAGTDLSDSAKKSKFSQDHLTLMVAIGHQAGLAIENTLFYQAKLQAERLAAVGQTIATLSHHIKNILQGVRGGSYLIDMGLSEKDDAIIRRGWAIVEKNQAKIYNLVMDMLSFSKEREPTLEPTDLNQVVSDVVELMQSRAEEMGVKLAWIPSADLPELPLDADALHRAILNLVTNAIDASEEAEGATVTLSAEWDEASATARVSVADNGVGIPEEDLASIFQVFASTKGARGTGLGLPVAKKIVREHGGQIVVTSRIGHGCDGSSSSCPAAGPTGRRAWRRWDESVRDAGFGGSSIRHRESRPSPSASHRKQLLRPGSERRPGRGKLGRRVVRLAVQRLGPTDLVDLDELHQPVHPGRRAAGQRRPDQADDHHRPGAADLGTSDLDHAAGPHRLIAAQVQDPLEHQVRRVPGGSIGGGIAGLQGQGHQDPGVEGPVMVGIPRQDQPVREGLEVHAPCRPLAAPETGSGPGSVAAYRVPRSRATGHRGTKAATDYVTR